MYVEKTIMAVEKQTIKRIVVYKKINSEKQLDGFNVKFLSSQPVIKILEATILAILATLLTRLFRSEVLYNQPLFQLSR